MFRPIAPSLKKKKRDKLLLNLEMPKVAKAFASRHLFKIDKKSKGLEQIGKGPVYFLGLYN